MKKIIITENKKGLLFKNGKFVRTLDAGKHYEYGERKIEILDLKDMIRSKNCTLEKLLCNEKLFSEVTFVEVGEYELAFHYVNGEFSNALTTGKYAYWKTVDSHDFVMIDISTPYVSESVPKKILEKIPDYFYHKVYVAEHEKAKLFFDNKFEKMLEPGIYYFWQNGMRVRAEHIDVRMHQMNITGQEIMTADKVSVRINFVCSYKITDYEKVFSEVEDSIELLHTTAQLALREFIGNYKLDEILVSKEKISEYVLQKLKQLEGKLYFEISDAGIKDIILPGEIRNIMNTVLVAEKRAQANVITRREEVASTRSLLNTAKLLDENETLRKLKELEYIEKICENVGNINLNSNGDLLTQLTGLIMNQPAKQKGNT